jgi:hypothetical protein
VEAVKQKNGELGHAIGRKGCARRWVSFLIGVDAERGGAVPAAAGIGEGVTLGEDLG